MEYAATTMLTGIENNIVANYYKSLERAVSSYFGRDATFAIIEADRSLSSEEVSSEFPVVFKFKISDNFLIPSLTISYLEKS